ncbi:2-amino-4-hydroxy-6-hydroxymethyldihydropteridine diphosphokinase [Parenemella sanctibonifatiensis]|uniref:2-amino-4-hydroxy-6-hydroxymethyldihydropteridine diphosphokinase n=1 Tax=Parenemella sanctibonifatiensis TaxID=2016505 RepID=A0A255EN01_9ACTN|nr:2-amino-4-hydroxy-6-hydroxymethyldihydropteridine diphosphokinase [Parenemella sanctibonifatiensis]OYN92590.1 2-amino-4-hydroxy-6-hydroxymethyldihydropteridine diphosphokinase [Parenemella sanctibonifatiensis]
MSETLNPFAIDADTLSGMKPLRPVVLSLGSNLGDRLANLQGALMALRETPDLFIVDVSSVWETKPWSSPEQAEGEGRDVSQDPAFLNVVVLAETNQEPLTMLDRTMAIEDAFGRTRGEANAPRTLDVDLIVMGKVEMDQPALQLPHPHAHERAFVLAPWVEIEPKADLPGHGPIQDLLAKVDSSTVKRREDLALED